MKKKAFTLFSTLILVALFSVLIIKIFEVKSLSSHNILYQHSYIQAKNHLRFLESYIHSLSELNHLDTLEFKEGYFTMHANIQTLGNQQFEIEMSAQSHKEDVRVYKKIVVQK